MRGVCGLFFVALLSACATSTGGGTTGGIDQVTAAAAAWRAAYDSRDPARITAMYAPDAVLWGTTTKTVAEGGPRPRRR
jgi:ketosteroid isomerase-like protein